MSEAEGSTITDGAINRNPSNSSALICVNLPVSAVKKENFFTADDKGLTLIHADKENRDRNNSDANRFDITCDSTPFFRRNVTAYPNSPNDFAKFELDSYFQQNASASKMEIEIENCLTIF